MIFNKDTAQATAEYLLQIKAIKLDNANPFTWTSGIRSPIYCDNRKTLSYPRIRTFIRQQFTKLIHEEYGDVDVVAGVATGAIAHGVLVAQDLGVPFVYVRSSQKEHGLQNKIEGVVESGQSVVVVEDLISTGKSSLAAVDALREGGFYVKGMAAIFTYGLEKAIQSFKESNCMLKTLTDYNTLIQIAQEKGFIKESDISSLMEWRSNPEAWRR
ncbi:MAG: orotate phosphoribosyltransferase [Bacteroidales bacterium]|nr:orotate phosphoribosyltransferase [Bacteroidales bacterium]